MAYSTDKIEAISGKLREFQAAEKRKRRNNKKETIRLLAKDIASLRKRGYTLGQIVKILGGEGLEITEPTLRNYLQQLKRPEKKAPARQKPAPQTPLATDPEESGEDCFDNNEIEGTI